MKHLKAYIKTTESGQLRQYTTVVDAENEFQAVNKFKQKYGPDCLIGWIMWYLQKSRADMRIATIATVSQKNIQSLLPEHLDKADYIICVEEDMTGTY